MDSGVSASRACPLKTTEVARNRDIHVGTFVEVVGCSGLCTGKASGGIHPRHCLVQLILSVGAGCVLLKTGIGNQVLGDDGNRSKYKRETKNKPFFDHPPKLNRIDILLSQKQRGCSKSPLNGFSPR